MFQRDKICEVQRKERKERREVRIIYQGREETSRGKYSVYKSASGISILAII